MSHGFKSLPSAEYANIEATQSTSLRMKFHDTGEMGRCLVKMLSENESGCDDAGRRNFYRRDI